MVRRHGPILRTACAASLTFAVFAALRFDELADLLSPYAPLGFLAGLLYTNLFEYCAHRFGMHRGLPLLRNVRVNHIEHHRIFHGKNFRTTNPRDLAHIAGRFWIFPMLFAPHYALASALLPLEAALPFLLACYLHYLAFEATHWLTHVEDNAVDRVVSRIPIAGPMRARQIAHHRGHHETPVFAYNFNPPYLGDQLFAARRAEPLVAVVVRQRLPARPLFLYGTAFVLGVIALGAAALAHHRQTSGTTVPRSRS